MEVGTQEYGGWDAGVWRLGRRSMEVGTQEEGGWNAGGEGSDSPPWDQPVADPKAVFSDLLRLTFCSLVGPDIKYPSKSYAKMEIST